MCLSHTKGGQEKENLSQQIPTLCALDGQFSRFALQNFCFCRHMWRLLAHPITVHCLRCVPYGANDASQTPALKRERVYIKVLRGLAPTCRTLVD